MNTKELEALVKVQGEQIELIRSRVEYLEKTLGAIHDGLGDLKGPLESLTSLIGADSEDGPLYPEFKELRTMCEGLREKVEGRNKSAAVKRNMTDADAMEVLCGLYKNLDHKEAADVIGLTYAQVYSCRKEFTFKHVHKTLRDEGWVNPWMK